MSEFELITQFNAWANTLLETSTLYLSVLFAYFVVAHLAGSSLTRLQLWIISSIYSLLMFSGLIVISNQSTAMGRFSDELQKIDSNYVPAMPADYEIFITIVYGAAFLASLYYMFNQRKAESSGDA